MKSQSIKVQLNIPERSAVHSLLVKLIPLWTMFIALACICMIICYQLDVKFAGPLPAWRGSEGQADLAILMLMIAVWNGATHLRRKLSNSSILITDTAVDLSVLQKNCEFDWCELNALNLNFGRRSTKEWRTTLAKIALGVDSFGYVDLVFQFGGRKVSVPAAYLSRSAMCELLRAVNTMASNCRIADDVIVYWDALEHKIRKPEDMTFTALWERELHESFGSAAYVPLAEGSKMGNLNVRKQLAMSGLAATYLVADARGEYVLKECVIPENANESCRQKSLEMFEREASLLAKLSHPGLVKVLDHFVSDNRQFLLMEKASGRTLRQMVRDEGAQSEQQVIGWAIQISAILDYMHGQIPPIVHRDISPENVLIAADDSLKLIDFGAAREVLGTATGTIIGKLSYMAPEQFRGKAELASDVYGLGCLMQFLLTGKDPVPFSTADLSENSISNDLAALILECTLDNPNDRPADLTSKLNCLSICRTTTATTCAAR